MLSFAIGPRNAIAAGGPQAIAAHVAPILDPRTREAKRSVLIHGVAAPEFAEALVKFQAFLARMETALASTAWLAGDSFTLADTAALPYVLRLEHLSMMPLVEQHRAVAAWYDKARQRPSYSKAIGSWMTDDLIAKMSGDSAQSWDAVSRLLAASN